MDVKLDLEIPKGYRFVRIGLPRKGENMLINKGGKISVITASYSRVAKDYQGSAFYIIVEPVPPELVPLGPMDIAPGCVFRSKFWADDGTWVYGVPCLRFVMFSEKEIKTATYEELMNDWLIKYPGKDWQACSKPKE